MFARSSMRISAPLRAAVRTYGTESVAPQAKTWTPWMVAGGALGTGLYGYHFLGNRSQVQAEAPPADAKKAFQGGDQGFISLKLAEVTTYNHDTKQFRFDLPESDMISGLPVASAVITKYKPADAEKPVIRPYTPVSDENDPGHMDLLIKVYPNGPMSEHMHSMKPGDTLDIKGPIPKYPWSTNKHTHITLISGGTGITPMYQLCRAIFNNPEDKTKVSLVYGNKTEGDILLREEWDRLSKEYPDRFNKYMLLDTPPKGWENEKEGKGKGYVTKELLEKVLPGKDAENIKVFVCGPPPLYKAVSGGKKSPQDQGELDGILKELGYTKEQVYKF